jgi:hypothetical protein
MNVDRYIQAQQGVYTEQNELWHLRVLANGFIPATFDYVSITYPTTTTEVYAFKEGGSSGTVLATVTLTYSDATKEQLTSVEKV